MHSNVVAAKVLHQTDHAVLIDVNGQSKWLPAALSHGKVIDDTIYLPTELAKNLGIKHTLSRAYDLALLQHELTLLTKLLIQPKPNQVQQQAAFDKLYQLKCFALFMQMRAGKTKVAIDIICNHYANRHIDRVLWLCPNSATATAEAQWDKFAVIDMPRKIVALETISACRAKRFAEITSFVTPQCAIIIDESQMIKNGRAKRSRRLAKMLDAAPIKGILTGTPITKNVQDLYNQARSMDWRIFGYRNYWQFQRAHLIMSDKFPGLIHDTINTEYLSDRLLPFVYEWFVDYRRKKEQTIYVEMSSTQKQLYSDIKNAVLQRLSNYTERRGDIYLLFTALQSVLSGYVSARTMQNIFANPKLNSVTLRSPKLDALLDYLNGLDEQKIIWCTRRHELHSIATALPDAITVSGEMDAAIRHQRIQQFRQSKNGTLVAMVQVAKRAIEMSECNEVIYYGHSFDLESREQSEWRTLLPTKTDICYYTNLIYSSSIDERIQTAHAKKRSVIQEFLDLLKQDRHLAIKQMEQL